MNYQVKPAYLGKVKLENITGSTLLDESTSQETLAKLFDTVLGKEFIESVVVATVVDIPAKTK